MREREELKQKAAALGIQPRISLGGFPNREAFDDAVLEASVAAATGGRNSNQDAADAWSKHQAALRTTPEQPIYNPYLDPHGDTKSVLQSLQNEGGIYGLFNDSGELKSFSPSEQMAMPFNQRQQVDLRSRRPGYGSIPDESGELSQLDLGLVNDPAFAKVHREDSKRAAFVYEKLTGRPMEKDLESHYKHQQGKDKADQNFVRKGLERGDHYDPKTGKWKVWQYAMPETSGPNLTGQDPRPVMSLVDATPDQQSMFERHYKNVAGYDRQPFTGLSSVDQKAIELAQTNPKKFASGNAAVEEVRKVLPPGVIITPEHEARIRATHDAKYDQPWYGGPASAQGKILAKEQDRPLNIMDATPYNMLFNRAPTFLGDVITRGRDALPAWPDWLKFQGHGPTHDDDYVASLRSATPIQR